jgi:phosphomethylpyrimidine synthase
MKITQEVREYARTHGLETEQALEAGMREKADEFQRTGTGVYREA